MTRHCVDIESTLSRHWVDMGAKKKTFWLKLCWLTLASARGGALLGLVLLLLTMTKSSKHSAAKGAENGRPSSRWTRKTVKATGDVQEGHERRNPASSQAMTRKSWHGKVEIPLSSRRTIGISLSVQSLVCSISQRGIIATACRLNRVCTVHVPTCKYNKLQVAGKL